MPEFSYVIITPAFNEETNIQKTIECVLAQSIKPLLWLIVDDGSTDKTAQIVNHWAAKHSWIHYFYRSKMPGQSYYSSNVYAIWEGLKHLQDRKMYYLAILDADISLPVDYYHQILTRMQSDERLGIASGVYVDRIGDNQFRKVLNDRRSTPKGLMVFKKQCYDDIGGFLPMKYGGEDTCACFTARMKGWRTWSFPDIVAIHNKPVGTGHAKGLLKIRFRQGVGEYFLASHLLFVLLKSLRRCMKEKPILLGGFTRMAGFIYAHFMQEKRQLPENLIRFIQKEQIARVFKGDRIPVKYKVEISKEID